MLTTLYLNAQGAMSEKLVGGASTTWRDYIQADGKMVAQRDKVVSTGTVTWSWFVTDHLGSVAVITNAAGAIAEQLGYDAWGKRRNAAGTDAACGTISSAASRGFTGHEMIDGLCLINMNARIYDPDLGRFMAADTMVADTLNLQDWNAYTYVNNNPLSFTDPSGHDIGSYTSPNYVYSNAMMNSPNMTIYVFDAKSVQNDFNHFVMHGSMNGSSGSVQTAGGKLAGFTGTFGSAGILQPVFAAPTNSVSNNREKATETTGLGAGMRANGATTQASGLSGREGSSLVTSKLLTSRMVNDALGRMRSQDERIVKAALAELKLHFAAHPEDLPSDVSPDFDVDYKHVRGPKLTGGEHRIRWLMAPNAADYTKPGAYTAAAGIENNRLTIYAGAGGSIEDAALIILHELGHHSPDAVEAELRILNAGGGNLNTPQIERFADDYAKSVWDKVGH